MKIILIIPYYGKLPEWISLFVKSCGYLKGKIDFLFFTDDSSILSIECEANVQYHITSFEWLRDYIASKGLGELSSAYKLCDYKPCYGYIFQDYIKDYEYWGYCDVDTILGDIPSFLIKNDYIQYDRIGEKGHFTIYRNTKKCRELFLTNYKDLPRYFDFSFVKNTTYPCHFDESGMNILCKRNNLRYLEKDFALQTTIVTELHLHTFNAKFPELFVFNKGHVFRYEKKNDSITKEEYMYIHFQDRKVLPLYDCSGDCFIITHLGFFPFYENEINSYFEKYGTFDTMEENRLYLKQITDHSYVMRKMRLKREFKICGIKAFYNLYQRILSIIWLRKNNMF